MNPSNTQQQHQPVAAQYYITGMPPLSSATSILKSNVSTVVSNVSNQQPNTVTTLNSIGSSAKASVTGNNLMDTKKYVTTSTNYMPVLLTNQTLITSIDPIKQQHTPKASTPSILGRAPLSGTGTTNSNILTCSKQMVLGSPNSAGSNITYQVLSTSQNNNLNPVITAPNGTVSVLLASTQPMATAGHVAAPIIIRNAPATPATKTVQITQQQVATKQQQQPQKTKLNTFPPQKYNSDILKQIVVGNPGGGKSAILPPAKTVLKPAILQNKPIIQPQQQQQQIQNKSVIKNTNMALTQSQQQQHQQLQHQKHSNNTVIKTTSENSPQPFEPKAAQTVQKPPQVSLLQNVSIKSTNNTEIINESVTALKSPNEIKVGNLTSEVSLIKRPNTSPTEMKSKESSLLKNSNKLTSEIAKNSKRDLNNPPKIFNKSSIAVKESQDCSSIFKSGEDDDDDISIKYSNTHLEKQKSLLKPKNSKMSATESVETSSLTSPRSYRSNSYNTVHKSSVAITTPNSERRHSEPSKVDLVSTVEMKRNGEETESINSQELEIFFEDEEYLESSGDKMSCSSEKYNHENITPPCNAEIIEIDKTLTVNKEPALLGNSEQMEVVKSSNDLQKKVDETYRKENVETDNRTETTTTMNNEDNSSDDDVTILPSEEVEIEQIEIDDDDDDDDERIRRETDLKQSAGEEKDQINRSLLCDEQFIVSSSSSISNNSSDQNSATTSLMKSPQLDNNISPLLKKTLMEPKVFNKKEEPHTNGYSSVLDMLSNFNMLSWRERIGMARGTNLKFQLNEFNLIQLYEISMPNKRIHTAYEKPIYERESSFKRNENNDPPIYYNCRRCNVQGPSVDFLAPEFCSLSCLKRDCRKRRDDTVNLIRKRNRLNDINNFSSKSYSNSIGNINELPNMSNPPPLTYIRKPKFRWNTYMNRNYNVIAAPISLFLNPFPTGPNNFLVGMKLEAIDPENCALFCVCTVIAITGYRLKLSFDGYSSAYDFWVNADSMDIFPPGWCAKTNRILQPPKGITITKFNWGAYLNKEKALPAPRYLFTHLNSSSLVPHNPFKIGMHLEAEDLNDTGKLCVSSVADVLDDRIRIHFDGWDDCYDIIVDINSPYIHPCGWHEGRQQLVVPPDCENSSFNWNDYIRKQGTGEAASEELFVPREPIGFKPNMRLEVVDPRNPSLIRPATVISHKGHRVKLHLDGWPSDYCFWLEDDSPDLHPIGWCDATGHDLEPPPGFQITRQKMPCPVDGCRGIGNAKNAFKFFHATRDGCPYAAENWRTVMEKPQRVDYDNIVRTVPKQAKNILAQQVASLQSRLSEQQILERLQMLDNIKTRNVLVQQDKLHSNPNDLIGSFPVSHLKNEDIKDTKLLKVFNSTSTQPCATYTQQDSDNTAFDVNIEIAREFLYDYGPRLQQNFNLWQKNFSFDAEKIKRNPLSWSTTEVSVFVDLFLKCRKTATIFSHEDIDGEAFLLLQQQDLTDKLGMKLGPAVKLYTCVLQLRTLAVTKFEVPYKRFGIKK